MKFHDFHNFRSRGCTLILLEISYTNLWVAETFTKSNLNILSRFWLKDIEIHRLDPEISPNNRCKRRNSLLMGFPELVADSRKIILLQIMARRKICRLYKPYYSMEKFSLKQIISTNYIIKKFKYCDVTYATAPAIAPHEHGTK